ncbi:MAG TPA: A24 family peptidase [Solirubrobacteraceae bacterium]|nr:A24 family peptidase [Solirubrobacteraceae bacterium]
MIEAELEPKPGPAGGPRPLAVRPAALAVAAGTIALATAVALAQSSAPDAILRGVLVALLVPCAAIDLRRRVIPNRITGPGAAVAIALGLALAPGSEPGRLLWAIGAGGFLLVAAMVNPAGMGMGDVKLVAMMGLFLGAPVAVALLAALMCTIATGAVLAARGGLSAVRGTGLPFGPYLAAGGLLAALAGPQLIHAYAHLVGAG